MTRYQHARLRQGGQTVDAIQASLDPEMHDTLDRMGCHFHVINGQLFLRQGREYLRAETGTWIIRDASGQFSVMTNADFRAVLSAPASAQPTGQVE